VRRRARRESAVSQLEGLPRSLALPRLAHRHVDDKASGSNFTFKVRLSTPRSCRPRSSSLADPLSLARPQCHRKDDPAPSKSSSVYAVNDIQFHPYGTFSTAGSDGTINFWDKESKTRLKSASPPLSLCATDERVEACGPGAVRESQPDPSSCLTLRSSRLAVPKLTSLALPPSPSHLSFASPSLSHSSTAIARPSTQPLTPRAARSRRRRSRRRAGSLRTPSRTTGPAGT